MTEMVDMNEGSTSEQAKMLENNENRTRGIPSRRVEPTMKEYNTFFASEETPNYLVHKKVSSLTLFNESPLL